MIARKGESFGAQQPAPPRSGPMMTQTVLPEACFRGGNNVGFATLPGFLTAISFNTLH